MAVIDANPCIPELASGASASVLTAPAHLTAWIGPTAIRLSELCRPIDDAGANFDLSETGLRDAIGQPYGLGDFLKHF